MFLEVEQAIQSYDTEHGRLFDGQGQRIYSDAEHAARLGQLGANLQAVLTKVQSDSGSRQAGLQSELTLATAHTEPRAHLAESELASANLRQTFVREDVEAAGWAELAARLSAALGANDKAELFLLHRYGQAKVKAAAEAGTGEGQAFLMAKTRLAEASAVLIPARNEARIKELKQRIEAEQLELAESARQVYERLQPQRRPIVAL